MSELGDIAAGTPVRCVTLNLAGMRDDWLEQRFGVVVRGLAPLAPDIICFQEATVRGHGVVYRQAQALGDALGLAYGAFAPYGNAIEVMSHDRGGVALVSRWPLRYSENIRLPEGQSEATDNRVAMFVTVLAPGGDLHIATVHLSWRVEEAEMRLVQLGLVLDYLAHSGLVDERARLVLMGDFNATEREPVLQLARASLLDVFRQCHPEGPGFTWIKANPLTGQWPQPDRRLDYMFVPAGVRVDEAKVVLDRADPVFASDHFGLFAALRLPCTASHAPASPARALPTMVKHMLIN
jgi:endonuclease/exonuclease/phosphatase family metal-dependent hydrolase